MLITGDIDHSLVLAELASGQECRMGMGIKLTESDVVLDVYGLFLWIWIVPSGILQLSLCSHVNSQNDIMLVPKLTIKGDIIVGSITLP